MKIAPNSWSDYVDLLKDAADLENQLLTPGDEALRGALYRQFAMSLSQGYFFYFHRDPTHPEFLPFENSVFLAQPNPDAAYHIAFVDGKGVYRVVGTRGNGPVAGFATGKGTFGIAEKPGPGFDNYDIDTLELDENGDFEFVFSAERPERHDGQWLYLNPESDYILLRQFSYDWGVENDTRVAIERLDCQISKGPMPVTAIDYNLRELFGGYVKRLSQVCLAMMERGRNAAPVNTFRLTGFEELGNTDDWPQAYFEAIFDIRQDEALILETALPKSHVYWNVQVIDSLWNQVELVHVQSSLNGHQAQIDSDGRFRAVLSASDPGVPNWLDTLGNLRGMLIGRWYRCSDHPVPTLQKVKLSELRDYLPAGTPEMNAEERRRVLGKRSLGAQLRRRW